MVGTTGKAEAARRGAGPPSRRKLGLWMATALVVGNMVGSGVFLLPSSLAEYGGVSILAWIVTALGAMALAIVFARLGRAFPATGGPYAYSRKAFGDFVGFQTAWGYWIAVWAGNAAIAVAFVGYLSVFWEGLATNELLAALVALAAIWFLTGVNALGVRMGGWVQGVTTALKLVPLVAIATVGLLSFDPDNFGAFNPAGARGSPASPPPPRSRSGPSSASSRRRSRPRTSTTPRGRSRARPSSAPPSPPSCTSSARSP